MTRLITLFIFISLFTIFSVNGITFVRVGYIIDNLMPSLSKKNITIVPVSLKSIFTTANMVSIAKQEKMYLDLVRKKVNVIIHTCDFNLMMAAHRGNIPYFLVNEGTCNKWKHFSSNVLKMNFNVNKRSLATRSITRLYRVKELIVITDFSRESTSYFPQLQDEYSRMISVSSNTTTKLFANSLLQAREKLLLKAINILILLERNVNLSVYKKFLDTGLYCGMLKENTRWVLPTYTGNITDFERYRLSGGSILTMKEEITGLPLNSKNNYRLLTKTAMEFTINVYDANKGVVTLDKFKKYSLKTDYGMLAFDPTTGELKNERILISALQKRAFVHNKFIWKNNLLRASDVQLSDENDWRIAVIPNSIIYNTSENGVPKGFAVDMMHQLSTLNSGINYSFVFPDVPINSTDDMDAMWDVVINMLVTKKADISFVPTPVLTQYRKVVSFSFPNFGEVGVDMVLARQNETTVQRMLWYLTSTFSFNVWIACGVSFLLLAFVLWVTDKISPNYGGKGKFAILDSLFLVAAAFMMAKLDVKPRMLSVRIFNILLWLATLLIMSSYAANLFQYILNRPPYTPVKTFKDALDYGRTFPWFFRKGIFSYEYFQTKALLQPNSLEGRMFKVANTSWPKTMKVKDFASIYPRLRGSEQILIGDSLSNKLLTMKHCDLQVIGTKLNSQSSAFPIRKGWNGKVLFDTTYATLEKLTIVGQVKQSYFQFNPCRNAVTTVIIKPLDIFDVAGIFMILGAGIVFSVIACVLELVVYKIDLSCQRRTGGGLAFGKIYKTTVMLTEPDGVWVEIQGGDHRQYFVSAHLLHPTQERNISPADLGIQVETKMKLLYYGNDPETGERMFRRPC